MGAGPAAESVAASAGRGRLGRHRRHRRQAPSLRRSPAAML